MAVALVAACAQAQQGAIHGDTNQIVMNIAGAKLSLQTDNAVPDDDSWKEHYVAKGKIEETVEALVDENLEPYTTKDTLYETLQSMVLKRELPTSMWESSVYTSALLVDGCMTNTTGEYTLWCPSGQYNDKAPVVAHFFATGLVLFADPSFYVCVLKIGDSETYSPATVEPTTDPSKTVASCPMPDAYHPEDALFESTLSLREGGVAVAAVGNEVSFFNSKPYVLPITKQYVVGGPQSELDSSGITLSVQLEYGDAFDDNKYLTVKFASLNSDAIASNKFKLDGETQIVRVTFKRQWLDTFNQKTDAMESIPFTITITDSHGEVAVVELGLMISNYSPDWADEGNSDRISYKARASILQRAGLQSDTRLALCYSLEASSFDATIMHKNCDSKGALLLLMRTKQDVMTHYFGGFNHMGETSTCGYRHGSVYGDVTPPATGADRGWMFKIEDATPDEVEYVFQHKGTSYSYYSCNNRLMSWGGGMDFTCTTSSCYCNIGYYYSNTADDVENTWCMGVYSIAPTELQTYDVYYLPKE